MKKAIIGESERRNTILRVMFDLMPWAINCMKEIWEGGLRKAYKATRDLNLGPQIYNTSLLIITFY